MKVKGRRVTIGVAVVGAMVIVWAGIAFKEKLVEQWYLWKLDSPEQEEQELAAEKLGQMRSRKAISRLIGTLRRCDARLIVCLNDRLFDASVSDASADTSATISVRSHYGFKALVRIGKPAVSALRHLLQDNREGTRLTAALALKEIDPQDQVAESSLRAIHGVLNSVSR